jgi:hypothetical protein
MSAVYLTDEEFRIRTLLPAAVIDGIESKTPGWLNAQLVGVSARVTGRLAKRYGVYTAPPYPEVIKQWVTDIVSFNAWLKRGVSATDATIESYKEKHDTAYDEMREAADSEVGLFDLPRVTDGATASGINRGGTRVYTEASPYVGFDVQADRARMEDRGRRGSGS